MTAPGRRRRTKEPRAPKRLSLSEADRARIIYRDPEFLSRFLSARGRIRTRAQTGLSRRDQACLARQVKIARELALLPYSRDDREERPRRGRGREGGER